MLRPRTLLLLDTSANRMKRLLYNKLSITKGVALLLNFGDISILCKIILFVTMVKLDYRFTSTLYIRKRSSRRQILMRMRAGVPVTTVALKSMNVVNINEFRFGNHIEPGESRASTGRYLPARVTAHLPHPNFLKLWVRPQSTLSMIKLSNVNVNFISSCNLRSERAIALDVDAAGSRSWDSGWSSDDVGNLGCSS